MPEMSRRRLLLGAGTAVGVGALGTAAAPASAAPAPLVLLASRMRRLGPRGRPAAGTTSTVVAALRAASDAATTGQFYAAGSALSAHSDQAWFETHHFALSDGTITGSGTVGRDGTGVFTITGSSGRYAGLRGSYDSHQAPDFSGTGHAVFTFRFDKD